MIPTTENLMFSSIDEIVSVAQSNLGMSEPDRNPIMRHWGYEAQRHIGLYHVNEKKEVKNITDLSFDMPCDMAVLIEIKLGDECECESSPNECNKCSFIFYKQERFCPDEHSHELNISMSGGKFHLSSNADEHKKATVRYLGLPLDDNLMQNQNTAFNDTLNVEYACLLADRMFNPIIKDKMSKRFPVKLGTQRGLENTVGKVSVFARSQDGEMTLQVKDLNTGKIGYQKQPVSIRDFSGGDLMISDIQLLTEVTDSTFEKVLPVFKKEGRNVAPYPYLGIKKSCPAFCYYEIYNLRRSIASGEYEIDFTVKMIQGQGIFKKLAAWLGGKKKGSISLAHTRTVDEDTVHELIGVDFSNLDSGEYQLVITVKDALNAHIRASVQKNILIQH